MLQLRGKSVIYVLKVMLEVTVIKSYRAFTFHLTFSTIPIGGLFHSVDDFQHFESV